MKIRLHGLLEEIEEAAENMKTIYNVLQVSRPYKDRGESQFYRIYIEVDGIKVKKDKEYLITTYHGQEGYEIAVCKKERGRFILISNLKTESAESFYHALLTAYETYKDNYIHDSGPIYPKEWV